MPDLVLFPHCDLHMALTGTPPLRLQVMFRDIDDNDPTLYHLLPVTEDCEFEFFAPYKGPAERFDGVPTVGRTGPNIGLVTATEVGIFLVQVRWNNRGIVARLQVHDEVEAWWFGNSSITTAVDTVGHAQPSIYAKFSEDAARTDLIGDITGHGYVALTSGNDAVYTVEANDRLRGFSQTLGTPVLLTGNFLGQNLQLPVHVVDYGQPREILETVRVADLERPEDQHNMLFLAEGFVAGTADEALFRELVTKTVEAIFTKPRHEPYPMLAQSFNVFSAFTPSVEEGATCAYRISYRTVPGVPKGRPLPADAHPGGSDAYSIDELIARVGLPRRDEEADWESLADDWAGLSLPDYDRARVNEKLVDSWRAQESGGILDATDTIFGICHGERFADRTSYLDPIEAPADDDGSTDLENFVAQLYTYWPRNDDMSLGLDPRRHPPERYVPFEPSIGNAVMRLIGGLALRRAPSTVLGPQWVPDGTVFKRSRGLVGIIVKDVLAAGANFNESTLTAGTLNDVRTVKARYQPAADRQRYVRVIEPGRPAVDFTTLANMLAHEFGHSFSLGDEYEGSAGDDPNLDLTAELADDNLSRLGSIKLDGVADDARDIDPAKVKWFDVPRVQLSARLLDDALSDGSSITVPIDPASISHWRQMKADGTPVYLRNFTVRPDGRQLPLGHTDAELLVRLVIGDIDEAAGTLVLGGPELPSTPFLMFRKGSALYVPRLTAAGEVATVVQPTVLQYIATHHLPLNLDTDHTTPNLGPDAPIQVPGLLMPCHASQLIGVYEGGRTYAGGVFRAAGTCKMRDQDGKEEHGEFCYLCKWLIVNRVNAALLGQLDRLHYPKTKKADYVL